MTSPQLSDGKKGRVSKKDGARSFDYDSPGADEPAKAQTIANGEWSAGAKVVAVTDAVTNAARDDA